MQQSGKQRYQSTCLVGNWSEELELYSSKLQAFVESKRTGSTKTDLHNQKLQTGLAPVQLGSSTCDGLVRFGSTLQLAHAHTGAVLVVDVADKDSRPGVEACAASASADPRSQAPVARSTFVLERVPAGQLSALDPRWELDGGDDTVRYGQKIRLLAHPAAQGVTSAGAAGNRSQLSATTTTTSRGGGGVVRPLALYSCPVGPTCVARSRHQLVGFNWQAHTFDSAWQVQPIDPAEVLVLEGAPVPAGVPVLLVHCATLAPLAVDAGVPHPNDFGIELSVSCHAETSHGKQLSLEHLSQGDDLRVLPKIKLGSNHWVFVTAQPEEQTSV